MRIIILLLWMLPFCLAMPWNRTKRADANGNLTPPPTKKPRLEQECYFSQLRKTDFETQNRPQKSIVSLECSENTESLSTYFHEPINPLTGETNATAILLCRGAGECELDFSDPTTIEKWKNVQICANHGDELLRKWDDAKKFRNKHIARHKYDSKLQDACSMPDEVCPEHIQKTGYRLRPLKIQESAAILKKLGFLVHPGIPICRAHSKEVEDLTLPEASNTHEQDKYKEKASLETSCKKDRSYYFRPEVSKTPAGEALSNFAAYVKVDRVCYPQKPFGQLEEDTKRKKVCAVKQMIDAIVEIVAPGYSKELKERVFAKYGDKEEWSSGSSKQLESVMRQVALQFFASENRQERLIILGLVANSVSLSKIQEFIPHLSGYLYTAARKFARRKRDSAPVQKAKREKYNEEALQSIISFITSPNVMIGLPYGIRTVKTSDGAKHVIPDSIRQQSSSEIYIMYNNYLKENNQEHLSLPRSTVFGILEICAATNRRATTCVDYYIAHGLQAFDDLHKILDGWIEENLTAEDILKYLKSGLLEGLQYLRTDYRLHVKEFSRVADHCANLALSDPKDSKVSSSCSTGKNAHKHDFKCERCEQMKTILSEIKKFADNFLSYAKEAVEIDEPNTSKELTLLLEKREEEVKLIVKYEEEINEMKKHMLRAAFTSQERQRIIKNLQNNEALVTLDFAQKYLPTMHREKQSDYFGKKGMSYHISHVAAKVEGKYVQHTFVHIYSVDGPQDSKIVVPTISHVASELKKIGIVNIHLRSDNAGAYHSAATIHSLHWIIEKSGMNIKTYTFSEAQNGKSSSDRAASQVKYKAERYVNQGHDVTTSSQLFDAMKHEPVLNGFSFHHGSTTTEDSSPAKWAGISNLNHFEIETKGIRGFRYGGIGTGHFIEKKSLMPIKGEFTFDDAGWTASGVTPDEERKAVLEGNPTKFWYSAICSSSKTCEIEADNPTAETDDEVKNDEEIGNLFACPEPGCSATFVKSYNLEQHVLKDQHKISPEKLTQRDYAFKLYGKALESVQTEHTTLFARDALDQLKETNEQTSLTEGFGLPVRQKRKPFGQKVMKYLMKLFDEGLEKRARPIDPMTAARRMRNEKNEDGTKMFAVEEWKTSEQISGFFHRETEKRRSNPRTTRSLGQKTKDEVEYEEYYPDEDEHLLTASGLWIRDPLYSTVADEMFNATVHSEGIFDFTPAAS